MRRSRRRAQGFGSSLRCNWLSNFDGFRILAIKNEIKSSFGPEKNHFAGENGSPIINIVMACFVLGAGATRGAKFVSSKRNPCLPPLDRDFFSQLQRISNEKHRDTVKGVLADTIELFGYNFQITMETVFTMLDHMGRMVDTTGENRDFSRSEIDTKKERLKQAVAAVLEESLCEGASSRTCDYHDAIVEEMRPKDDIISFNYDCLIDETLRRKSTGTWNPRYGYAFNLGKSRDNLKGHDTWMPEKAASKERTIHLYKMHGSLHFKVVNEKVQLKKAPYNKRHGNLDFTIIPPEANKKYDEGVFRGLWRQAGKAIHRAEDLVLVGYSFPLTDSHANALFRISVRKAGLKTLVIVNPDREARHRAREILKRGLNEETRVLVFDSLEEFSAVKREVWGSSRQ